MCGAETERANWSLAPSIGLPATTHTLYTLRRNANTAQLNPEVLFRDLQGPLIHKSTLMSSSERSDPSYLCYYITTTSSTKAKCLIKTEDCIEMSQTVSPFITGFCFESVNKSVDVFRTLRRRHHVTDIMTFLSPPTLS